MTNEKLQKKYVKADMQYDALKDNIHYLAEENKELKERYETLKQEHIDTINRNEEKQQRIDKAIEKLKEIKTDLDFEPWSIYQVKGEILFDLFKILGDKEND